MTQNTCNDKLTSAIIEWLRFPMTVMVVLIHQNMDFLNRDGSGMDQAFNILVSIGSHVLPSCAVPMFFLFSGYLYFYKMNGWDKDVFLNKTRRRVKSLLIPYVLWIILAFIVTLGIIACSNILHYGAKIDELQGFIRGNFTWRLFWDINASEGGSWCLGLLEPCRMTYPMIYPFWFVRNLLILVLLTPIIHYLVKRLDKWFIFTLGILYLTNIWVQYPPLRIDGVFYFCLGCYLSINKRELSNCFDRIKAFAYVVTVVTFIACVYLDIVGQSRAMGAILPCFALSSLISAISLTTHYLELGRFKIHPLLLQCSFFVFAIHTIGINSYCSLIFNKAANLCLGFSRSIANIGEYVLSAVVTIMVCIMIFIVLKRGCPKILGLLTGGRGY